MTTATYLSHLAPAVWFGPTLSIIGPVNGFNALLFNGPMEVTCSWWAVEVTSSNNIYECSFLLLGCQCIVTDTQWDARWTPSSFHKGTISFLSLPERSSIVCCPIPLLSIILHKLSILTFRSLEYRSNGTDVKIWRWVNNRIMWYNLRVPVIDTGLRGLCRLILTWLQDER